jgi:hypothetical protein
MSQGERNKIDGHIWKMGDCVEAVFKAKGGHTVF